MKEVLAALASGAGKPVPRRKLWSWLWPDLPRDCARKALNTEIWRFKKFVSRAGYRAEDLVESSGDNLQLCIDRGFSLDVHDFQEKIRSATSIDQMISAADIYKGDFADGVEREWVDTVRRELRATFRHLLLRIVQKALDSDRFSEAHHFAHRMIAEDPYDEEAARKAIRAAIARGDNGEAAKFYLKFAKRLKEDLDVPPSPRTAALYQECRSETKSQDVSPGFRIETAPASHLAVADARRKILAIADLVTAIRSDLRSLASDLDDLDR
ncbi:MAG: AfsR/SARP family transcriptional regulator [Rhizobiaceae bacterium]